MNRTRALFQAVVVEQVKLLGYTESETGAGIVLVDSANAGEVPGESAQVDLQTDSRLARALRADQCIVDIAAGIESIHLAHKVHALVNRVAEARAVHENIVLGKQSVWRLQDFDAEVAHQLEFLNLLFQRNQSENIRGVGSNPARLIRIRHDETEAKRHTGLLAGRLDNSNLRGQREIPGIMRRIDAC